MTSVLNATLDMDADEGDEGDDFSLVASSNREVLAKLVPLRPDLVQICIWGRIERRTTSSSSSSSSSSRRLLVEGTESAVFLGRKAEFREECRFSAPRISNTHCALVVRPIVPLDDDNDEKRAKSNDQGVARGFQLFVKDYSRNGTWVNGVKLGKGRERILREEDKITLCLPRCSPNAPGYSVNFEDLNSSVPSLTLGIEERDDDDDEDDDDDPKPENIALNSFPPPPRPP